MPAASAASSSSVGRRDTPTTGSGGSVSGRQEDQARLEQGDVALAAADVAAQRGEQARQQRRAQLRLLLGQRVGQPQRPPPRVVVGQAERRPQTDGADERVGQHLDVAGVGQRPADRPARAAAARSARVPGGGGRQHATGSTS